MSDTKNEVLPVLVCRQPPVISQNIMDIQAGIQAAMQTVENAPKDREGLAQVKQIRAKLRKAFDEMESQRMAVKKAVMEPYDKANAAYRDMIAEPMKNADAQCKRFIDGVQNDIKQACVDELKAYFDELVTARGIPWLTFERCPVKVDMAVASKKDYKREREQIAAFVDSVGINLDTISGMEDANPVLAYYIQSLDLAKAMCQVQEQKRLLREAEERNAENLRRAAEREQNAAALAREAPELAAVLEKPQAKTFCVKFRVTATVPMLRGLKYFLENNHYTYEEEQV